MFTQEYKMHLQSESLINKINSKLNTQTEEYEVIQLLESSNNSNKFKSEKEFESYLTEGSLLNISTIGSKALSVPCGEYLVWTTDVGTTMLVPTSERSRNKEVFEQSNDEYEVLTKKLMMNWNKLEKTLIENNNEENLQNNNKNDKNVPPKHEIDMSSVDRTALANAMDDNGFTVTSLASAVGVQAPAISRVLRKPKDTPGDPGGRNPSIGLASEICNKLRLDPAGAFPDIFNPQKRLKARKTPGNAGSGAHSHGRSDKWTKGNTEQPK